MTNAKAERFMRTLKYEEIYMNDNDTLAEVRASIEHFIEAVYNRKRLHSAIGYRSPVASMRIVDLASSPSIYFTPFEVAG